MNKIKKETRSEPGCNGCRIKELGIIEFSDFGNKSAEWCIYCGRVFEISLDGEPNKHATRLFQGHAKKFDMSERSIRFQEAWKHFIETDELPFKRRKCVDFDIPK